MKIVNGAVWAVLGVGLMLAGCGGGGGGTDASASAASPAVVDGQSDAPDLGGTGRVTLAWSTNPTNVDGSCTAGLRGYHINMGLAPGLYSTSLQVDTPQVSCTTTTDSNACGAVQRCSYTIETLTSASWYIALQAEDLYGNRSGNSEEVIVTVYGG